MGLQPIEKVVEDDFDDNAIASRTDRDVGFVEHPADGLVASGDVQAGDVLKGVYRPEWRTVSGSPSASSGELVLADGSTTAQQLDTPVADLLAFDFSMDFKYSSAPSTSASNPRILHTDYNNEFFLEWLYTGEYDLTKVDGGTGTAIISSSNSVDTNWHTRRVTRDAFANWEYFFDGASQGTTTDDFVPSGQHKVAIGSAADVESRYDNLVVS